MKGDLKQVKVIELICENMQLLHEEQLPDTAVAEIGDAAVAESQESQDVTFFGGGGAGGASAGTAISNGHAANNVGGGRRRLRAGSME